MGATTSNPDHLFNGDDQKFRHMIYDILAFGARLETVRNGFGSLLGIAGPQYSILIVTRMLNGKGGRPSVGDIADYMHVSGAFVTAEVKKLERLGLLEKHRDPADGRRVLLALTDEAQRKLNDLTKYQVPVNDALFAGINRSEFETLSSAMERLVAQSNGALRVLDYFLQMNSSEDLAATRT